MSSADSPTAGFDGRQAADATDPARRHRATSRRPARYRDTVDHTYDVARVEALGAGGVARRAGLRSTGSGRAAAGCGRAGGSSGRRARAAEEAGRGGLRGRGMRGLRRPRAAGRLGGTRTAIPERTRPAPGCPSRRGLAGRRRPEAHAGTERGRQQGLRGHPRRGQGGHPAGDGAGRGR